MTEKYIDLDVSGTEITVKIKRVGSGWFVQTPDVDRFVALYTGQSPELLEYSVYDEAIDALYSQIDEVAND